MILYREIPKEPTKKTLLGLIHEFSKVTGYKINVQKSVVFLYASNEQSENQESHSIHNSVKKNFLIQEWQDCIYTNIFERNERPT